jgi:dihydrolipoamide dehydrogenase
VLTPEQALQLAELPETLSIFGNDYIALELATIFARLGVNVKLFSPSEQILAGVDPSALRLVQAGLRKLGVQITTKAALAHLQNIPIVISNGVQPNTKGLHLDAVGVQVTAQGAIAANTMQQSSVPHMYAVGDCTGGLALASVAIKQGKVAAEVLSGQRVQFAPLVIPLVVHTTPELAAVGYSAEEAARAGYRVTTGRFPLAANGRALTLGTDNGIALIVADADNGALLGATVVGPRAGDLIGQIALGIEMGATLTDLSEILHAHPALSEVVLEGVENALGKAVHIVAKGVEQRPPASLAPGRLVDPPGGRQPSLPRASAIQAG